jgi:threonine dehydrogenase-like Zn-dependent dehydrogenase
LWILNVIPACFKREYIKDNPSGNYLNILQLIIDFGFPPSPATDGQAGMTIIEDTMKAIRLKEYEKLVVEDIPVPAYKDDQVLVRVGYASICGSDQHIFKGDFHPRTILPMTPGHEFGGTIVEIGKNVTNFEPGDRVAVDPIIWCGKCPACELNHYPACTSLKLLGVDMDGGFAEYVAASEDKLFKLTSNISDQAAALIELFSIGFHASNRAGLKEDDTVAIWGAGKVGHAILQAVRTTTKNTVFMVDLLDKRLQVASDNYEDIVTINATKQNPVEIIQDFTSGKGVDIAFEAVGHAADIENQPNPVQSSILSIRGAGTVCVLGLSSEESPILTKELIWREAKIVASRVNHGEFEDAIEHLSKGNLKPEIMISKEIEPSQAMKAFRLLENEPENYLKIMIKLNDL